MNVLTKKVVFITYRLSTRQVDFFEGKSNDEIAKVVESYVETELPWCEELLKVSVQDA